MEYRQVAPPADLTLWVECAWVLRGALAPQGQIILPDGRIELVFHLGDPPVSRSGAQPVSLIAGARAEAVELCSGSVHAFGVRFHPEAAALVFPEPDRPAVACMESVLGPWARQARERLGNACRIEDIWDFLRSRFRTPDAAVAWSVRAIEVTHGRGPIEAALPDGLGLRQWQRRFLAATGHTPKAFARIARFQHLIARYEAGQRRWSDLALDAGYYDQSHLVNEFRSFSGCSPHEYFRAGIAMPEFHRDVFFQDYQSHERV